MTIFKVVITRTQEKTPTYGIGKFDDLFPLGKEFFVDASDKGTATDIAITQFEKAAYDEFNQTLRATMQKTSTDVSVVQIWKESK